MRSRTSMNLIKASPSISIGTYINAFINGVEAQCQVTEYWLDGNTYHYQVIDKTGKESIITMNDVEGLQE